MSNRSFRISSIRLLLVGVMVLSGLAIGWCQTADLEARLTDVTDPALRRVLSNSVKAGLISTNDDFDLAIRQHNQRGRNNPAISTPRGSEAAAKISQLAAKLPSIDRDAMKVTMVFGQGGKLFAKLNGSVPSSYDATVALCKKFNPANGTYDSPQISKNIDQYLQTLTNDPCMQYALQVTNTSMTELKNNWFGRGNGFEHVFNGEAKGKSVGGYHFWYKFYVEEAQGDTKFIKQMGSNDPCMFTGTFNWDPDGAGPMPNCTKKKGGFTVGNSAAVILALGHIAIETARSVTGTTPSALNFQANINGKNYNWQLYTMNDSIRSLYPIVGAPHENFSTGEQMIREFYDLEEGMGVPAGATVH